MPPVRSAIINEYVGGDDLSVVRTVSNIPTGRLLVKAWLTVKTKATDADPGLLQKVITPTPQSGVGQITDQGADGVGVLLFLLTPTDTQTTLTVGVPYAYDVQAKFDDGSIATIETSVPNGYLQFNQGVTSATS